MISIQVIGSNSNFGKNLIYYLKSFSNLNVFNENYKLLSDIDYYFFIGYYSPSNEIKNDINLYEKNIARLIKVLSYNNHHIKINSVIVFFSAISVYGETWDGNSYTPKPEIADFYSLSKLAAESILEKFCKNNNLKLITLRLPGILHDSCKRNFICQLIQNIKNDIPIKLYSPNNYFNNLIGHKDLNRLCRKLIDIPEIPSATINVGCQYPIRIYQIIDVLCEMLNKDNKEIFIMGEKKERIISVDRLTELGFTPKSVLETLREEIIF